MQGFLVAETSCLGGSPVLPCGRREGGHGSGVWIRD